MNAGIKAALIAAAGVMATLGLSPRKIATSVIEGVVDDIISTDPVDSKRPEDLVYITLGNGEFEAGYESVDDFFRRQVSDGKILAVKCFHFADFILLDQSSELLESIMNYKGGALDIGSINRPWSNSSTFNSSTLVPLMVNETILAKSLSAAKEPVPLKEEDAIAFASFMAKYGNLGFSSDFDKVCGGEYLVVVGATNDNLKDVVLGSIYKSVNNMIQMSYVCTYLSMINKDGVLSGASLTKYSNFADERSYMLKLISNFLNLPGLYDFYSNSCPFMYTLASGVSNIDASADPSVYGKLLDSVIADMGIDVVRFHFDVLNFVLYSIEGVQTGFTGRVWLYSIPDVPYKSYLADVIAFSRVNRFLFSTIQHGLFYSRWGRYAGEVQDDFINIQYPEGDKYLRSLSFKAWALAHRETEINNDDRWFRYHIRLKRKDDHIASIKLSGCTLLTTLGDPWNAQTARLESWSKDSHLHLVKDAPIGITHSDGDDRTVDSVQMKTTDILSDYDPTFLVSEVTSYPLSHKLSSIYISDPSREWYGGWKDGRKRLEPHFGQRFGNIHADLVANVKSMKVARHCNVMFLADYSNFAVVPKLKMNLVFHSGNGRAFNYDGDYFSDSELFAVMNKRGISFGYSIPEYVGGVSFAQRYIAGTLEFQSRSLSNMVPIAGTSCQSYGLTAEQLDAIRRVGYLTGRGSGEKLFTSINRQLDTSSGTKVVDKVNFSRVEGRLFKQSRSKILSMALSSKSQGTWSTASAGLRHGYLPDNLHRTYPKDKVISPSSWPQCYQDVMSELVTPTKLPFRIFLKFRAALGEDKKFNKVTPGYFDETNRVSYFSSDPIVNEDTWTLYYPDPRSLRYGVDVYVGDKYDSDGKYLQKTPLWNIGSCSLMLPFDIYGDEAIVAAYLTRMLANPINFSSWDDARKVTLWDIAKIKLNRLPFTDVMPVYDGITSDFNTPGWSMNTYAQYKDDSPLNYLMSNPLSVDYTIIML